MATSEPAIATAKQRCADEVTNRRAQLLEFSHAIHDDPELSWQEHAASARVAGILRDAGFAVTHGAHGVDTAVEAVYGSGEMVVGICAEYDSLPGIGHACGHNVIATAGVGAALALQPVADEAGLTIKLLGTPAEEHGGGKVTMLEAGAWEDVDFSLMVHGTTGPDTSASASGSLAVDRFEVEFTGRAAHASAAPEQAVNASAASTLALTALALLRQHLPKDANANAFVSLGGEATNIIPERTVLQAELRAEDIDVWHDLKRRVLACFEGAAIATGCDWSWKATENAYAPVLQDRTLADLWDANLTARGRTIEAPTSSAASTDMGNVSQVVPAIHPTITFIGHDCPAHTVDFTAAAATPAADDAAIDGATILAWTVLDAAMDTDVRADLQRRKAERPAGATTKTLKA